MKCMHLGLTLLLLFMSSVATAQASARAQTEEIDTTKFCVYAGKIYSIGSLVEAGGALLECRAMPSTSELVEAGARWARLAADSDA